MFSRLGLHVRSQLLFGLMRLHRWAPHAFGFGVRQVEGEPVSRTLRWFLRLIRAEPVKSTPESKREVYDIVSDSYLGGPVVEVDVIDTQTSGTTGVHVRVYLPKVRSGNVPGIMWIHGGGHVIGSLRSHDRFCRRLCHEAHIAVVALEYRLAPEYPYPAAHEDVGEVYEWLRQHAVEFGIDVERLGVGGDSAGGSLTAALCQRLPPGERPALQVLCYPGTDLTKAWPSYEDWADGYFLSRAQMRWFLNHHCPPDRRSEPSASPLLATSVEGQPTALLITAGMDPLLDEGRAYGDKLEADGVEVERFHVGPMVHGFITLCGAIPLADESVRELALRTANLLRR